MSGFGRDLGHALRGLARSRGFAASVVVSLAIGIGANAAVFSVASALLLRPLPYADAERLVILWNRSPGLGIAEDWFSTAQYHDIQAAPRCFDELAIAIGANYNLTGGGAPERVGTIRASANLLPMLGARAVHGRLFGPQDAQPGTGGRAVLGHAIWMRRFGGDPGVVGGSLVLNGEPYQVIGVLEEGFDLPREVMPTLGASPRRLLAFVLGEGMAVALLGVAAGLGAALAFARAMRSLLFGVSAGDPLTFLSVPSVLLLAALAACYLPARRAAAVDPATSLRSE